MPQAALSHDQLQAVLADVWQKSLPLLKQRVTVLEQGVAALAAGRLAERLRAQAGEEAHKLAGLLGMFGYPEGTDAARMLEITFDARAGHPGELLAVQAQDSAEEMRRMREVVLLLRKIVGE